MPLTTIAYLMLFLGFSFWSVAVHPVWGVFAYLITYNINPLGQWWGVSLPGFLARYSYILALVMAAGFVLNKKKIRCGKFWETQEILFLLFIGWIVLAGMINEPVIVGLDDYPEKMAKVAFILMLVTHIVTSFKHFRWMVWVLVLVNFYLGMDLFLGAGAFRSGRLHSGVGGSDFGEGNFLAAHFGFALPLVGALFLRGGWKTKAVCVAAGVFITNGLIMARSRGALLALGAGVGMTMWATLGMEQLRKHRTKIVALLIVGMMGGVYLTDADFWVRMTSLVVESESELDSSAEGRLMAWRAAVDMFSDHLIGVGPGNYFEHVGYYAPSMANRDTHNTYLRCAAELGLPGLLLMGGMILCAIRMLFGIQRRAAAELGSTGEDIVVFAFALRVGMIIYLAAGMFISATYVEDFYWMLLMPVLLKRALNNEILDQRAARTEEDGELEGQYSWARR